MKVKVKVAQLCLTLCKSVDYTVHGILQARILEWVAIPSSGDFPNLGMEPRSPALQADSSPAEPPGKPKKVKVAHLCPTLCDSMDSIVHGIFQARILEWVAVPSPGDLPNPGIELSSPALQVDSLPAEPPGKPSMNSTKFSS